MSAISVYLDKFFPERVTFREEESRRAAARQQHRNKARAATKVAKARAERRRAAEVARAQREAVKPLSEEQLLALAEREVKYTRQIVLRIFGLESVRALPKHPKMYEVEIPSPRTHRWLDTYVYTYVVTSEHGASVLVYAPPMWGKIGTYYWFQLSSGVINLVEECTEASKGHSVLKGIFAQLREEMMAIE